MTAWSFLLKEGSIAFFVTLFFGKQKVNHGEWTAVSVNLLDYLSCFIDIGTQFSFQPEEAQMGLD